MKRIILKSSPKKKQQKKKTTEIAVVRDAHGRCDILLINRVDKANLRLLFLSQWSLDFLQIQSA